MNASFWKSLEALGATGAALHDWKHHLGGLWDECARYLKPTGQTAFCVIDPRLPARRLTVDPDGADGFVGYDEDDTAIPPVPFAASEVAEFAPHWKPIGEALAGDVGFDYDTWESGGHLRRIGTKHEPNGRTTEVLLFLPTGGLGDYHYLFSALSDRFDAMVMVPTARWVTEEIAAAGRRNRLSFLDLSEYLAQLGTAKCLTAPVLSSVARRRNASPVRTLIRGGNGLSWKGVRIEVGASRRIRLSAPGQDGEYDFPSNIRIDEYHALGILMRLATKGEWRNPALGSPDYFRVSKAFLRLRQLLKGLVSLPGEPFQKHRGAFVPVFQIGLNRGLVGVNRRDEPT
jgi:hypothetical protein